MEKKKMRGLENTQKIFASKWQKKKKKKQDSICLVCKFFISFFKDLSIFCVQYFGKKR